MIGNLGGGYDLRALDRTVASNLKKVIMQKPARKGNDTKTLSAKSINKYLGCYTEFWRWLGRHYDQVSNKNPFEGMLLKETKVDQAIRLPYSDEQVQMILNYSIKKPKRGREEAANLPSAAHWFPKVLLYTGLRLNELAEVSLADVYELEGVWVLSVSKKYDRESRANKSESAIRVVPLHKSLIKMGFIEFVQAEKTKRVSGYLFDELYKNKNSAKTGRGTPISKWFSRSVKVNLDLLPPSPNTLLDLHSFRTTFITKLKNKGVDAYLAKQVVGHTKTFPNMPYDDLTFDGYAGEARTEIHRLKHMVDLIEYGDSH